MQTTETNYDDLLTAFTSLADLDKLAIAHRPPWIDLRIGFVVSLFFIEGHTAEQRHRFVEVLRHYYETFADHLTHFVDVHIRRIKPIKDTSFFTRFDKMAARAPASEHKNPDINTFSADLLGIRQGEDLHDAPFYYCGGTCLPLNNWFPAGAVSYLDMHIPASWVMQQGAAAFVNLLAHWCSLLRPQHGTAGLGTLFNPDSNGTTSNAIAFPLVKRFPGLDYNDSLGWRSSLPKGFNQAIRTTNWLNVLDSNFVARLGGRYEIAAQLGPTCPVHPYEGGLIIQAGPMAELGDINRQIIPEPYRTVARLLKPLRFEDYGYGLLEVPEPLDRRAETKAWLARFD